MIVKLTDAPGVPGGKAFCLCDDAGDPLPMQSRAVIDCEAGGSSTITATFLIDGEAVRIVG